MKMAHHVLRSLRVDGGFLDGARFDFHPEFNCIIGGRGTGKSTALEFIRYALDRLPADPRAEGKRAKIEDLVHSNLEGGELTLGIQTLEGTTYEVQRTDGAKPVVATVEGRRTGISIGKELVFGADIYSQNEIEEIAENSIFQLDLVDRFIAKPLREAERELDEITQELMKNANDILKSRQDAARLAEQIKELPDIDERLKSFAPEGDDQKSQILRAEQGRQRLRQQETKVLKELGDTYSVAIAMLDQCEEKLRMGIERQFGWEWEEAPNASLIRQAREQSRRVLDTIHRASRTSRDELGKAQEDLGTLAEGLASSHHPQERTYQKLLAEAEALRGRERERLQLVKRQTELRDLERSLKDAQGAYREQQARRKMLRARLSECRDKRFALRREIAETLNKKLSPMIRVKIEQYGNAENYRLLLISALKGSGLRYASIVEKIVESIPPAEFATLVQEENCDRLQEVLGLDPDRAMRLILQLKDCQAVYDIETVELFDRPMIELRDGDRYKDSASLSTGQKCTTILPILLLESENPLVIDQPEDNLDNAFVYDTVVRSIRAVRGKRQLIFVTHNPNIPVLGEAGMVFVLDSNGNRGTIEKVGSVDDTKTEIEDVLEGGREAFKLRMKRYGY